MIRLLSALVVVYLAFYATVEAATVIVKAFAPN